MNIYQSVGVQRSFTASFHFLKKESHVSISSRKSDVKDV